jgi:hypothetical protein
MMSAQSCWMPKYRDGLPHSRSPVRIPPPGTQSRGRTLGAFGKGEGSFTPKGPGRRPIPCPNAGSPGSTVGQSASYFASISASTRMTLPRLGALWEPRYPRNVLRV